MAPPILAIQEAAEPSTLQALPNLLPCRIHHTGSMGPISEYWKPTQTKDESNVAYFRGRRLEGTAVSLPQHFDGVVVQARAQRQPAAANQSHESEPQPEKMQVTAYFDKVMVWCHGAGADKTADPYLRGINEWLQVAAQVHSFEDGDEEKEQSRDE
ncbi:hypothetical protein CDD81_1137 [Ophiocordyceps australis]|uniref:Uncharacterized protein n=1 Tax=Ophiocordyceps australis TaxID=1399860 RepID=A0A2C5Y0D3_9HYPO|nr:hypothetical protein CDD81_1137 [Ophiocordyceps australis]